MSVICPTITANDAHEYREQMEHVNSFAQRIHIDLMDGVLAPTVSPEFAQIWLPDDIECDVHVMYQNPQNYIEQIKKLNPSMVVVHAESNCDIPKFAADLRDMGIKTGVAVLQDTKIEEIAYILPHVQHLLIFSGNLGHFGGQADLALAKKATEAKALHKHLEIGWDGGINAENCTELANLGIDVLNVGGAIQKADSPQEAYATMVSRLDAIKND